MSMLISVIIPVYNSKNFLKKSINSIIDQTYKEIEVILVDDGSTDGSDKICDRFCERDPRINVIHIKNGGVSHARNVGIACARGKYIVFVDSDDWVDSEYIEKAVEKINKNPVDILFTPYIREYKNNPRKNYIFNKRKFSIGSKELIREELLRPLFGPLGKELHSPSSIDDFSPVWGKFYKSQICKKIKFTDIKSIGAEDTWYNINFIYKCSSVLYVDNIFYHYNKMNNASLINKSNSTIFKKRNLLYNAMENFIHRNQLSSKYMVALDNRKIIDLIGITNNVFMSGKTFKSRCRSEKNILKNPIYNESFKNFEFQYLPKKWYVFFKLCKSQNIKLLICLVTIGEKLKPILK